MKVKKEAIQRNYIKIKNAVDYIWESMYLATE